MEKLTCSGAKQIDLVDYLASLGHQSQKINNQDYWYLSPLRDEKTPSFKVNRKLNMWYDHATGKGGNLIDFGTQYFKCSIAELLQRLSGQSIRSFSFHPHQQTGHSHNVSGLCVRAGFGAQNCQPALHLNRSTKLQVCTSARLTQNPC